MPRPAAQAKLPTRPWTQFWVDIWDGIAILEKSVANTRVFFTPPTNHERVAFYVARERVPSDGGAIQLDLFRPPLEDDPDLAPREPKRHAFEYDRIRIKKVRVFDEPRLTDRAYEALLDLSDNILHAIFAGYPNHREQYRYKSGKQVWIQGQPVRFLTMRNGVLRVEWNGVEYELNCYVGFVLHLIEQPPLPPYLEEVLWRFGASLWRNLPDPLTQEEKDAKRLAKASDAILFGEEAPAMLRSPQEELEDLLLDPEPSILEPVDPDAPPVTEVPERTSPTNVLSLFA